MAAWEEVVYGGRELAEDVWYSMRTFNGERRT